MKTLFKTPDKAIATCAAILGLILTTCAIFMNLTDKL